MAMAKTASSLLFAFLFMVLLSFNLGSATESVNVLRRVKSWCVAKPSTDIKTLREIIDFCCADDWAQMDCSIIREGGPCYEPIEVVNHASVVMNIYYQRLRRNSWNCDFNGNGLIVTKDPSYGECEYDFVQYE